MIFHALGAFLSFFRITIHSFMSLPVAVAAARRISKSLGACYFSFSRLLDSSGNQGNGVLVQLRNIVVA
jgi:hypothetical protein